MADSDDAFFAATLEDEKKLYYALGSLEYVKLVSDKWTSEVEGEQGKNSESVGKREEDVFSHHSAFAETLKSAVNFCLSQYQILILLSSFESGIATVYIKNEILGKLEKDGEPVSSENGVKIYKIGPKLQSEVFENEKRAEVLKLGSEKIGPSVFLGMVASFDALIVDIVGKLIQQNPSRFVSNDKTIPISDIIEADSIDDIVKNFVADELFRFSRESHDFQNSYIEKQFSIKIRDSWKRYSAYIEVFERRNLVAHGEKKFNARYATICERVGHKGVQEQIGQPLKLSFAYQRQAIYLLSEYAILLSFVLWRKYAADKEDEAFETLNEAAYKLIQDGHYVLAERILDFALSLKNSDVREELQKMIVVNHASALGRTDNQEACAKALETRDWSGSALQFQLSVAALKKDIDTVIKLVPQARALGFDMISFRSWPVFRFIREDEKFNDALEAAYGERLKEAHSVVEHDDAAAAGDTTLH